MPEDNSSLICKRCNKSNPDERLVCIDCGAELEHTTDSIDFEIKPHQLIADRYEILQEVGRGSMGVVFRAFDKKLERYIALKTLKIDESQKLKISDIRKSLISEAKTAAKLEHPNIVVIHDVTEQEKFLIHIAMELIDGIPLSELIVAVGLNDFDRIVDIIFQICDGISHAHEKGIIHRDLKPSNILLLKKKIVKITDFGISIIRDKHDRENIIMGTIPYMSPERFEGVDDDPRSDIYSIGIILYELLTGKRPFVGATRDDLIYNIRHAKYIPLRELRPDLPFFFDKITTKAIEPSPYNRYQNAIELKTALLSIYKSYIKKTKETKKTDQILNVPLNRNVNFTGRNSFISNLRKGLTSHEPGSNVIAIYGLGGMGKTQIALEYTLRHSKEYSVVWWLRADEQPLLASEFAALAVKLDLPVKYLNEVEIIGNTKFWLANNSGWLLVFDNAEGPVDIKKFLPESSTGHIIITTRNPNWGGLAKTISINEWDIEESVEFLLKRTKDKDKESASNLAITLGNLPLALEQAGAYIEGSGRPIADYLALFKKHQKKLLSRGKPADYPDTVATTWEISFRKLKNESQAAVELLNLCSFLATDHIPMSMISDGSKHLPQALADVVSDPIDFDDAVSSIRAYSLIDRTGDYLSLHRLVQTITHDKLVDEEKKSWIETLIRILLDAFVFDKENVETWETCSSLLPHALTIKDDSETFDLISENLGSLLNIVGLYLFNRGQYLVSKSFIERAISILGRIYEENDTILLEAIQSLGIVEHNLGNLKVAKKIYERVINTYIKLFGSNHPKMTKTLNHLGLVLRDTKELDEALKNLEKAYEIDMKFYGKNHPDVARDLSNIGNIYFDLCNFEKARECFERSKEIFKEILGMDHPSVAYLLNNLGRIFQELGDFAKAKDNFENAISLSESKLGKEHPQVVSLLPNLGRVYHQLGDLTKAKTILEYALSMNEKVFGKIHLQVAYASLFLALLLKNIGEIEKAKDLLNRALSISRHFLNEDHEFTQKIKNNLLDIDFPN
jgi:serine/threonine protein kinase/Tfp pilus assembly protein PilF